MQFGSARFTIITLPAVSVASSCARYYALLLLLAWLPMLAYVGHWGDLASPLLASVPGASADHNHEGEHDSHCHTAVASCSDGVATGVAPGAPPLERLGARLPSLVSASAWPTESEPTGRSDTPPTPPPRTVA